VSRLQIRRSHALKHAEAHARISAVARELSAHFGAVCHWEGDVLRIEHANVTGTVTVKRREIVVDARLGFVLSLFRGRAEAEITEILDRELAG
jgi:putative polyhydroxyalkanoate system protein